MSTWGKFEGSNAEDGADDMVALVASGADDVVAAATVAREGVVAPVGVGCTPNATGCPMRKKFAAAKECDGVNAIEPYGEDVLGASDDR